MGFGEPFADTDGEYSARTGESAHAVPRLLAMGGCTVLETIRSLGDAVTFRHYWRYNVLCDMSPQIDVSGYAIEDEKVLRVLDKHARKFHLHQIIGGDFDILVMECTSDLMFRYVRVDGAILPDVRNDLFVPGWADISFDDVPALRDAEMIWPQEARYWDMWKAAFERLYADVLLEHLRAGKKVVFIKRLLCTHFMSAYGLEPLDEAGLEEGNAHLRDIFAFMEGFPGISLIEPPAVVHQASAYAPWGGPWSAHPEREFYDHVGEALLRLCAKPEDARQHAERRLLENLQERIRLACDVQERATYLAALEEKIDERDAALVALQARLDARDAELASRSAELASRSADLQLMTARLDHCMTDRQRLEVRVALMQKRYAPVRAIYRALQLGRFHRWRKGLMKRG